MKWNYCRSRLSWAVGASVAEGVAAVGASAVDLTVGNSVDRVEESVGPVDPSGIAARAVDRVGPVVGA